MKGDPVSAERDFRSALDMQTQLAAGDGGTMYEWKIALADLLAGTHRCAEALPLLEGALDELNSQQGAVDSRWQPTAELLRGHCLIAAGRRAEGDALEHPARATLQTLPGIEDDLYPTARRLFDAR
jgi:hypothetical protein